MNIIYFLLILSTFLLSTNFYGASENLEPLAVYTENVNGATHSVQVFPIEQYQRFVNEAQGKPADHQPPIDEDVDVSMSESEVFLALRPTLLDSRAFIRRSFEDYAATMTQEGKPTRLIIGCGHNKKPDDCMNHHPHSNDYFTINIRDEVEPDVLGNVFFLQDAAFKANSWDFILFECFPWKPKRDFVDKNLRMLANSLRPNGVWVIPELALPALIKIGEKGSFREGCSIADEPWTKELYRGITQHICYECGKMADTETASQFGLGWQFGDLAVFHDYADVRTTVNDYFVRHGFESAELRTLPAFFTQSNALGGMFRSQVLEICHLDTEEKTTLDLSKYAITLFSPLTNDPVVIKARSRVLFDQDIDILAGEELVRLTQNFSDFAFIVRK